MVFLALFKQRFFQLIILFLIMLVAMAPLAWLSISHPQHVQNIASIISQNTRLFSAFRWVFILAFFIFWKPSINHISARYSWPLDKVIFWQKQRLKIICWLVLFELVLCENLLLTVFHLLERI